MKNLTAFAVKLSERDSRLFVLAKKAAQDENPSASTFSAKSGPAFEYPLLPLGTSCPTSPSPRNLLGR